MEFKLKETGESMLMEMSGKLTYADQNKAKEIESLVDNCKAKSVQFDLSGLSSVDSSGFGMLIRWKDAGLKHGVETKFLNPTGIVAKSLKAAHLDDYLSVDQ